MAYATVMVHVELDSPSEARVRLAQTFADQFHSTLIGVAAAAVPPLAGDIAIPGEIIDEEHQALRSRLAQQEEAFRQIAGNAKKLAEWRSGIEPPTDFLARQARTADLVIIGRERLSSNIYSSLDPAALILAAGRPVLVVPTSLDLLDARSVLVAWKDTREARRALQDSLPFLHEAEHVFVVAVTEDEKDSSFEQSLADVLRYLTRHRINATARTIAASGGTVASALLSFARENHVGLLVAGAYGHSRLGEWVFGGVTREVLRTSPICCLLSH